MRKPAEWTGPEEIQLQLARLWDQGRILSALASGEALFPFRARLRGPSRSELGARFPEVREWIRQLVVGGREARGFGYELEWSEVNLRELGRNRIPEGVVIPTGEDALRMIQKVRPAERFRQALALTEARLPLLCGYFAARPLKVLEQLDRWPALLATVEWFRDHPRSGLYLRQLDIPGVDTKLLESNRGLLTELLERVVRPEPVDPAVTGRHAFEQRYGLRSKPSLVRLRILDPQLAISGLTDLSALPDELARLELSVRRVFITENEINGLAFPPVEGGIVLFGLGYGLERLRELPWLRRSHLHYWGDLDTHGFAILNRLREVFPEVRSLLMDRATLLGHRSLWGQELPNQRHLGDLFQLTAEEGALYDDLRTDRLGVGVRLEQERIAFGTLLQTVTALESSGDGRF